jgi:hypothetical protein
LAVAEVRDGPPLLRRPRRPPADLYKLTGPASVEIPVPQAPK